MWQAILRAPRRHDPGDSRETVRLAVLAALFAALDTSLALSDGPTTGWLGPHAGLVTQLLVDASLPLLARRHRPVAAFVLVVALAMAVSAAVAPGLLVVEHGVSPVTVPRATPVVVIAVVLREERAVALAVTALFAVLAGRLWSPDWSVTPFGLLSTVGPALGALYFDARKELMRSLRDRAERAEREQSLLAEKARFEERRRLAAEMHDVVTHRLSLIVLHAGALRLSSAEPAVHQAADDIRASGSQAMAELRDLMGVLRSEESTGPLVENTAPGPVAADFRTLVEESESVGIPTGIEVDGAVRELAPVVARTAYRVVQEALTNVRKHAPGSHATVSLHYTPRDVRLRVTNSAPEGRTDPVLRAGGSGAGLTGLRYRVEVIGGTLDHGPTGDGGFRVDATLPVYVPTPESRAP
ncbi:histidine kinase [Actinokineospora auranticolor]|uniref:sensor histidine kinase n=1 Tax=Actinokineospora auranticolor TaxID=155976 RepID=UPI001FEAE090|nr:histidine kinase [Actinokineospora auranticolor]